MSTVMQARERALEWCKRNRKWKRICDIPNSDSFTLSWNEIPKRDRAEWEQLYGHSAEDAWRELSCRNPCRHRYGFIGDDGNFYAEITLLPRLMNSMMVFEVGGKPGIYYRGGLREKSCRAKV